MARGRDCAVGPGQCIVLLVCAGGYSCRRRISSASAPSQDFSERPAAVQERRAQASSPVQQLIISSTSSSSVTARSQGHPHRHAAAYRGRRPCFLPRRGDVWGSTWFCTATPHQRAGAGATLTQARTCCANMLNDDAGNASPTSMCHPSVSIVQCESRRTLLCILSTRSILQHFLSQLLHKRCQKW